ncbi:MAG: hypothetical protein D6674_08100 [Acidobacteria bacterium]|jgi:hypothetical protein|nr:MAG: hypothetical protein D6674_08100 [Acidobacteriota bacterium]
MMLKRVITSKDGHKSLSIEYNPITKSWSLSNRKGREMCLVPSDLTFIKREEGNRKEERELLSRFRGRFQEARLQTSFFSGFVYLGAYRGDFDCEAVELEPFALARLFSLHAQDGMLIDWGRRKTTFVRVREGLLESFRVVLRGGDYISEEISKTKGIPLESVERMKASDGLSLTEAERAVKTILELSGYSLERERVLLTGGGSRLKGLRALFKETIELKHCQPELASCLGACLREVLKNPYPDFEARELTKDYIKRLSLSLGSLALFGLLSLIGMHRLYNTEPLLSAQRSEFKRLFPREPIVSLHKQVKAKTKSGEEYRLSKLLLQSKDSLKEGMKLYSFEYSDGKLSIRGEADQSILQGIKTRSTKTTPTGRVEFEVSLP